MSSETVTAAELAAGLWCLVDAARRMCCSPETRLGSALEHSEELLARYHAQQDAKAQECTSVAASWCPRCGDCTCSDREDFASTTPDDKCPLHGLTSTHAEPQQTETNKPALSEAESVAVNVVNAHDVVVRISHRTVRGIEASVECDKAIEALRDALKRIGAL